MRIDRSFPEHLAFDPEALYQKSPQPFLSTGLRNTFNSVQNDRFQCNARIQVQNNPIAAAGLDHVLNYRYRSRIYQ